MRPGNLGSVNYWFGNADSYTYSRLGGAHSWAIYMYHKQQQEAAAKKKKAEEAKRRAAEAKRKQEERARQDAAARAAAKKKFEATIAACGPLPKHQCPPKGCKGNCPPFGGGPHTCLNKKWVCHGQPCPVCAGKFKRPPIKKTVIKAKKAVAAKTTAGPMSAKEAQIRRCVGRIKGHIAAHRTTPVAVCGRGSCTEAEFRAKCGG